jgi:phosphoglycolate phosphatase-like HAD superfamily hydrolase
MLTEDKKNFETTLKGFMEELRFSDGLTKEVIQRWASYLILYRRFQTRFSVRMPLFRKTRLFNNMVVLFNRLFNQNFPKTIMTAAQLRIEAKYFETDEEVL